MRKSGEPHEGRVGGETVENFKVIVKKLGRLSAFKRFEV